ncbi:hypothetical protein ABZ345_21145 [Lentzea sp. NPDC005914]|uniref:hypothetical protein n=1 Tax=Lentzea sp. NPDC005914 TaxID=3154572 RepID=UPI0033CD8472
MLAYVYEVTKYNPIHRDERGHYNGPVEAAYLSAMAAFAGVGARVRPAAHRSTAR